MYANEHYFDFSMNTKLFEVYGHFVVNFTYSSDNSDDNVQYNHCIWLLLKIIVGIITSEG